MKVIKIGAVWCNACVVMKPRWKEIESENPWLETEYFDFDIDEERIKDFNLDEGKLPTFIFKDKEGNEFLRLHGEIAKDDLLTILNENKHK